MQESNVFLINQAREIIYLWIQYSRWITFTNRRIPRFLQLQKNSPNLRLPNTIWV